MKTILKLIGITICLTGAYLLIVNFAGPLTYDFMSKGFFEMNFKFEQSIASDLIAVEWGVFILLSLAAGIISTFREKNEISSSRINIFILIVILTTLSYCLKPFNVMLIVSLFMKLSVVIFVLFSKNKNSNSFNS